MAGTHFHHGHRHGVDASDGEADRRLLSLALGLIVVLMAAEVAAGILASSLALLSDAGHMVTDAAALAFSLVAARLAARPAAGAMTFGLKRVEILSAQANGVTLLVLALLVVYEGVRRLVDPPDVDASVVLVIALAGACVNAFVVWLLARADRSKLNVEGSFQHIVTDLYAFVGTAVAAVVIILTGFSRADAIASLLVAALMLRSAVSLLKASGRVFLEAAPAGVDPQEIGRALAGEPGVVEVHDLHVWEVTSGFTALSAHVLTRAKSDCHAIRLELERLLLDRFGIDHTTLQVEHESASLLTLERPLEVPGAALRTAPRL